jgi:hypothetical protein
MPKKRRLKAVPKKKSMPPLLLDAFSMADIKNWGQHKDAILQYHAEYYSVLAQQRSQIFEDLKKAVLETSVTDYSFSGWQRIVSYQYTLSPLSVRGSVANPAGGRFNIGDIDHTRFPSFPALYIAEDKETALVEVFCNDEGSEAVPPLDLALTNPSSFSCVALGGKLD